MTLATATLFLNAHSESPFIEFAIFQLDLYSVTIYDVPKA